MRPLTVYSAPWCGHCHRLKAALTRAEIPFVEVDVDQTPRCDRGHHRPRRRLLADPHRAPPRRVGAGQSQPAGDRGPVGLTGHRFGARRPVRRTTVRAAGSPRRRRRPRRRRTG
ncbi:glutaredoxin family protein [Streptosporangium vulgare]|uniref:glutaredoxin family protein n=1 Tax=Streptosporangium vulgare TaxID=46190 RepID=UPI0031E171F6